MRTHREELLAQADRVAGFRQSIDDLQWLSEEYRSATDRCSETDAHEYRQILEERIEDHLETVVRPSYRQSEEAYTQLQGMEDSATACFRDNQGNSYQELDDHTLMGFIGDINQLQRQHHTAEEELNDTLDSLMEAIELDRPLRQQPS